MQVVVRRATLASTRISCPIQLFVRRQGAVWLWEFPLADRLAAAATLAGGGADAETHSRLRLVVYRPWPGADDQLAGIQADELPDAVYGRMAFLRATNRLFTLADPSGQRNSSTMHPAPRVHRRAAVSTRF